ncbi:MAG: RNA polymerase sigma factor [Actinomycetota bacterium]|nr:sigma-70 family RNA polymerase sigma factor [Actinomycetota bacterium]
MDLEAAIARARAGDKEAFADLYRAFASPLLSFLASRVRRRDDAEDLVAQTFLEAMRDIARFDGDAAGFRAWLFRIGHHRAIDLARRKDRRPEETLDAAENEPYPVLAEDEALDRVERALLWEAVQALPDEQRRVLVLRLGSGLSSAEIAEVVGKRTGAVKALQHRALVNLVKALGVSKAPPGSL